MAEEKSATATEAGRKTPIVVVPYEGGTDPATATRVLLPQEEFLKLWKAAHPEDTGVAPVEGGVLEALYTAKVAGENGSEDRAVNVSARYVIQSHVDGQWQVVLPIGTVAIQSAKLNGEPATIAPKDQGYLLVVPKAGSHVLDVEFAVPAK
ncbi:MAG: hypothetical protein U0872_00565 [Planctomycetaceae bacterium]